jgi:RNA polymerase sigma-70 factor (ECF subfamily)
MPATSTGLLRTASDPAAVDAWGRLVSLYEPLLHGWLRREGVQHADSEDLVQEILTTVAQELPHFRHNGQTGAFRSWLRQVLANRLRAFRRAQRTRSLVQPNIDLLDRLADQLHDPATDLSRRWDEDHDRYLARKLLQRLEPAFQPRTWRAFERVAVEGANPEQVAQELGLTIDAVYAAKSRILKRLQQEAVPFLD